MTPWTALASATEDEPTLYRKRKLAGEGRLSCRERVERCLSRIDEHEARVRAWVHVDREGALDQADRLDSVPVGHWPDPRLAYGAVLGVKDIVDVAGLPTSAGVEPRSTRPALRDAPLVARLREAGAIILGKTVTTAHAWIDPPITRNPWDSNRTPGGSSSGSAAAVALGMCEAAIGTQTGGSLIRPASFCGVYALKPSYGALPTDGIRELARTLDHAGFLGRSVLDLAILFGTARDDRELPAYPIAPRIGRVRGPYEERASEAMNSALDLAHKSWIGAGASVTDLDLTSQIEGIREHHYTIMSAEAAHRHGGTTVSVPESIYPPRIRELIHDGMSVSATEYLAAVERRTIAISHYDMRFDRFDVLVLPSATDEAPDASTTGDPAFNSPWSYLGFPVLNLPIAGPPESLPLGAQLVGKPGSDVARSLFRFGMWCEAILRGDPDPRHPGFDSE